MFCKTPSPLETKKSERFDPPSYSYRKLVLIKKQTNCQQSDQIVFQNDLRARP